MNNSNNSVIQHVKTILRTMSINNGLKQYAQYQQQLPQTVPRFPEMNQNFNNSQFQRFNGQGNSYEQENIYENTEIQSDPRYNDNEEFVSYEQNQFGHVDNMIPTPPLEKVQEKSNKLWTPWQCVVPSCTYYSILSFINKIQFLFIHFILAFQFRGNKVHLIKFSIVSVFQLGSI